MYLPGGHDYFYFTYGLHCCMNVVTGDHDIAEAVLLRAAQPLEGIERMRLNRTRAKREIDLMSGPGKLCQALAIDRSLVGADLASRELSIAPRRSPIADEDIAISPRIGVENSGEAAWWPLRFFLRGNPFVSMPRSWRDAPATESKKPARRKR